MPFAGPPICPSGAVRRPSTLRHKVLRQNR
jgi:hypothetical protein